MSNKRVLLKLLDTYWIDICVILLLVALKIILHGINLNEYPYFENDEATYTIRAASFQSDGSFDSYTYWYDHAPAGWIL